MWVKYFIWFFKKKSYSSFFNTIVWYRPFYAIVRYIVDIYVFLIHSWHNVGVSCQCSKHTVKKEKYSLIFKCIVYSLNSFILIHWYPVVKWNLNKDSLNSANDADKFWTNYFKKLTLIVLIKIDWKWLFQKLSNIFDAKDIT